MSPTTSPPSPASRTARTRTHACSWSADPEGLFVRLKRAPQQGTLARVVTNHVTNPDAYAKEALYDADARVLRP
ncbi:hypothetical protein GCM10020219_092990 [Nonomuraea dietziae]